MTKFDVTDTAVFDASPETIFNAVVDVFDGRDNWWLPHLSSKLRTGSSCREIGTVFDVTVHLMLPVRFTGKTIEVHSPDKLHVQYIRGAFQGDAFWTFEKLKSGTQLCLRWQTSPSGLLLKLASLCIAMDKGHSQVMQKGFANLTQHLGAPDRAVSAR